jgi:tetratricopeptide (TPR) repeat protein
MLTMIELAALYELHNKYAAAEHLRLQIVQIQIELSGVLSQKTILAIIKLLANYEVQRKYLDVAVDGLNLTNNLTAAYGPKHFEIISTMAYVVVAWMKLGRLREAEKMVRSAIDFATGFLKPNNRIMILSKRVLAYVVAYLLLCYGEAENIFREILSILEKEQKPDKVVIVYTRSELATLLMGASRFPEAEHMLISAEELWSSIPDPSGEKSWDPRHTRAMLNFYQGHYSKAETGCINVLKEGCKIWTSKDTLGAQHLDILIIMAGLGQVYSRVESYAKADQILGLVRKAYVKLLGQMNSKTLNAVIWECLNQSYMEHHENALTLCLRTKEDLKAIYPPTHEDVVFAHTTLARLYLLNGQHKKAEESAI